MDLWANVFTFLSARPSCSKFKGTLFIACGADLSYVRVTQHRTLCTILARFQLMIAFVFHRKECALLKSCNNRNKYWNILAHLLLNITNEPIYFLKLRYLNCLCWIQWLLWFSLAYLYCQYTMKLNINYLQICGLHDVNSNIALEIFRLT